MARTDEPIIIAGAGPVGMALALELARHGCAVMLADRRSGLGRAGSRAINLAGHALRFLERIGAAEPLLEEGTSLTSARTYYGRKELFARTIERPAPGVLPAFVNIPQSRTEAVLAERVAATPLIELRWRTEVTGVTQDGDGVRVDVARDGTAETLAGAYLIGCDGGGSRVRECIGAGFPGRTYDDRFLIADIRAQLPFPNERRFYFNPPSNPGRQILVHPQPDDVWRIDWQVPAAVDADRELATGAFADRVSRLLGPVDYELVWLSSYRFHQRLAGSFRSGRVFLAGDAAHVMSPFGGRGLNSGLEDAANLGWKLGGAMRGQVPEAVLDTYARERRSAAVENLDVTGATMRFMVPEGARRRLARNAVLRASVLVPRVRRFVNSGRLAEPARYPISAAVLADGGVVDALPRPGDYAPDRPCKLAATQASLGVQQLRAAGYTALVVPPPGVEPPTDADLAALPARVEVCFVGRAPAHEGPARLRSLGDPTGELRRAYGDAGRVLAYVLRPDGYVAARTSASTAATLWPALGSLCRSLGTGSLDAPSVSRADRARAAVVDGNADRAICEIDRMVVEHAAIHDLHGDIAASLVTFIGERLGEDAVAAAWRHVADDVWRPLIDDVRRCGPEALAEVHARNLRAHGYRFEVLEDDEKWVFESRYSPTGERMVMEGKVAHNGGDPNGHQRFGATREAHAWTLGLREFPYYDVHSVLWFKVLLEEWGWPVMDVEYERKSHGGFAVARHVIFKAPRAAAATEAQALR